MINLLLLLASLAAVVSTTACVLLYVNLKEITKWHDKHQMDLTVEKDKNARLDEKFRQLEGTMNDVLQERNGALAAVDELDKNYRKLLNQKKSSEVRVGKIGENLAPFLNGWPYDPNSFRFLGNPIDGIQFADDKIRFVEIKTGKARLSASQKWIKDLVKKGQVSFVTFRVGEDGCTLIEDEMEI